MAHRYILHSSVDGRPVPVGHVYLSRPDAEEAARDLNALLPSLRTEVMAIDLDDLESLPESIREHLHRHPARDKF